MSIELKLDRPTENTVMVSVKPILT